MKKQTKQELKDMERQKKNAENRERYHSDQAYADKHREAERRYQQKNRERLNENAAEYLKDPVHLKAHNDRRKLHRRKQKLYVLNAEKQELEAALCQKAQEINQCQNEIQELEFIDGRSYEGRQIRGRR